MHELKKFKDLACKLNYVLSRQQKQYGVIVFICAIISAVLEMLGVSAIMPMVEGILGIDALYDKWYLRPFVRIFHVQSKSVLMMIVCLGVILIYIIKNLYFIAYTWLIKKYTFKINRELSVRVMESYMAQGYIFFVNNNSSKLIQGISGDISAVNLIMTNIFNFMTKVLSILIIGIFILLQEPFIAIFLLVLSAICVLTIQFFYKKSMRKYGTLQREAAWNLNQARYEMIQGSKEILVTGRQNFFKKRFVDSIREQNKCNIKIEMAMMIPAYIIEMACVIGLIVAVAIQIVMNGTSVQTVAGLSAIAVAAFRILPAVGGVSSAINTIQSSIPAFNASYETIKKVNELEDVTDKEIQKGMKLVGEDIRLQNELTINHVYYRYPNTEEYILMDVLLKIKARSSIGIIGASGAGKTTFVDVLLGLLEPEKGQILLDGRDITTLGVQWNKNIGYVPQMVYLIDEDIRANIAFGISTQEIDDEMVWHALELAQLADFVREQPKGLDTRVGEMGVRFSGGQRQRVAIARALYMNPEILVLDEATAALDNETENALMEAIDALQGEKTLIVVAHRLTTIRRCDCIYEVVNGKLVERTKEEVFGSFSS